MIGNKERKRDTLSQYERNGQKLLEKKEKRERERFVGVGGRNGETQQGLEGNKDSPING